MKCQSLTRAASRSHTVKSVQAHMTHNTVTLRHIIDATIQLPSESFVEVHQHDTFLHEMETRGKNQTFDGI